MKTVVSGASGLIGSALVPFLTGNGYQVARLVRSKPEPGGKDIHWDPSAGTIDVPALEGCEAAVHRSQRERRRAGQDVAAVQDGRGGRHWERRAILELDIDRRHARRDPVCAHESAA